MSDAPKGYVKACLRILRNDMERLERIDCYARGHHDDPYLPRSAGDEYRLLAKRSVTNLTKFIVDTPAQGMYVDGFRRGESTGGERKDAKKAIQPEWRHWQKSRLDARQSAIYRGALTFGHSFTVTEKIDDEVATRGLSALRTTAIYEDAANDDNPLAALHVVRWPAKKGRTDSSGSEVIEEPGIAILWDRKNRYDISFKDADKITVTKVKPHGLKDQCPVTRFAAAIDLEGRCVGVIEPMIPLQDRLNQSVMDLLVSQSGSSFKVRTVTGMAPPMQTKPLREFPAGDGPGALYEDPADPLRVTTPDFGEIVGQAIVLDSNGKPIPESVEVNAKRMLFAKDKEVKFGTLDETPLDGFIASIEMTFKHISALTQTPPHYLLGQIANLSAEAMTAAETALQRKTAEMRASFGESWERVFRIAAALSGDESLAEDYSGEVLWRDMEGRSLAQAADAYGKLAESLGIPKRGLWDRVPGVTPGELDKWDALREEDDTDLQIANAYSRNPALSQRPKYRSEASFDAKVEAGTA